MESASWTAKSTSPGLWDTTFYARLHRNTWNVATLGIYTVYDPKSISKFTAIPKSLSGCIHQTCNVIVKVSKILCFMLKMIKDIEDIVEVAVEVEAPGEEEEVVVQEM